MVLRNVDFMKKDLILREDPLPRFPSLMNIRRPRGRPRSVHTVTITPELFSKRCTHKASLFTGTETQKQKALGGCGLHELFCKDFISERQLKIALKIRFQVQKFCYEQGVKFPKSHVSLWKSAFLNTLQKSIPGSHKPSQKRHPFLILSSLLKEERFSKIWGNLCFEDEILCDIGELRLLLDTAEKLFIKKYIS